MRIKTGSDYLIHVPAEDFIQYVTEKAQAMGEVSYSEEFTINDVSYDKETGFIHLSIDMYKRMDA